MKNGGASAPHAIIVCAYASGLVVDIRIARVLLVCAFPPEFSLLSHDFARYTTYRALTASSTSPYVWYALRLTRHKSATRNMSWDQFLIHRQATWSRDKIDDLFSDHPYGADNNICYQKKKELGTCTRIEIKGTCGTTEVITASMSC